MKDPLSRIDLNLLVAFQVLMQERNVTRAAERLFVTQPAMSKTLNRLRITMQDDLFVRSSHGLTPTTKALELEGPVNTVLGQLTALIIDKQEFSPADTSATIAIATLGTSSSIGLPRFLNKLNENAPNLFVICQNIDDKHEERLRTGSLDFAIIAKTPRSNEFITHKLMDIQPMLYMRKGHPLANKEVITTEDRQKFQHMAVYFPNAESSKEDISKLFASFGILTKMPFLCTNVIIGLETIKGNDILMIASDRLSKTEVIKEHFTCKPLIADINLKIESISLVQHVRTKNSELHSYIAQMIIDSFQNEF